MNFFINVDYFVKMAKKSPMLSIFYTCIYQFTSTNLIAFLANREFISKCITLAPDVEPIISLCRHVVSHVIYLYRSIMRAEPLHKPETLQKQVTQLNNKLAYNICYILLIYFFLNFLY